jgi:hypothetical protein
LDDVGEGVVHMVEVEVQAHCGRRANHSISIQSHKLPVAKQLHVLQEMHSPEALLLGERGEADALQFFELLCVLRAGLGDHESTCQLSVVPHRIPNLSQIWPERI